MSTEKKGLVHIYCGEGKGKSTAAAGLAIRAAGYGMKVLFARFLKNEQSGEVKILDQIPEVEVLHLEQSYGFYWTLSEQEKKEVQKVYRGLFETIRDKIAGGSYSMLVMDEFMAAYGYELIDRKEALQFIKERPENLELVLTGRDPGNELVELADYVSDIKKIKHPFDLGIQARAGIEY